MVGHGQWIPAGSTDDGSFAAYWRLLAQEEACAAEWHTRSHENLMPLAAAAGAFFTQNHAANWPHESGADQRLVYRPMHCELKTFDASRVASALRAANTTLALVGDSLTFHSFLWLRCQLRAKVTVRCTIVHMRPDDHFAHEERCALDGGGAVVFYRTQKLPAASTLSALCHNHSLTHKDLLMLSVGAGYEENAPALMADLRRTFQQPPPPQHELRSSSSSHQTRWSSWPRLFWREPLPQHFEADSSSDGTSSRALFNATALCTIHAASFQERALP